MAIANSRLIALNNDNVTFKWKDYRNKGRTRQKRMTLDAAEFIRRFLLHVLPSGFHRIRHYGLIANARRKENLVQVRKLLMSQEPRDSTDSDQNKPDVEVINQRDEPSTYLCRICGAPMMVVETFESGQLPRAPPVNLGKS